MKNTQTLSITDAVVFPISAYGPTALIMLIGVALLWLSFSTKGRNLVIGVVDVAYVTFLFSLLWLTFLWLVYLVFFSTFVLFR